MKITKLKSRIKPDDFMVIGQCETCHDSTPCMVIWDRKKLAIQRACHACIKLVFKAFKNRALKDVKL